MCGFSFLKTGTTFAILSFAGKIPVESDWFIIRVIMFTVRTFMSFRSEDEIPSCPLLDFGLRACIISSTLVVGTVSKLNFE